ncbi:hypothetical protein CVT24_008262 [Panaeolus cyanescens]|uniref:Uncharacterized protein n=1 Tax=Panaeolus cyanescens TaxID=181874 RepID=A0A409W0F3_9AGAR|nr:hypothetical protein CVT24_008262 [Panaeolus cyanescens]
MPSDSANVSSHSSPSRQSFQSSRPTSPTPGDADSDTEMQRLMRSSPDIPDSEDNMDIHDETEGASNLTGDIRSATTLDTMPAGRNLPSNLRAALVKARRQAERLKLHPYQIESVEAFVQSSSFDREVQMFTQLLAAGNKLESLATAAPAFSVSTALMDNIKSYVCAILLSSRLSAYKGTTARNHVFVGYANYIRTIWTYEDMSKAIIARERTHVPPNFDKDVNTKKTIMLAIQNELTQARSRIKKEIRASLAANSANDLTESLHILDLATDVVSNTQLIVTVPLCARLALLRSCYRKYPKENYWDKVDVKLAALRQAAKDDAKKLKRAMERLLDEDRALYGDKDKYKLPDDSETSRSWQHNVENIIT